MREHDPFRTLRLITYLDSGIIRVIESCHDHEAHKEKIAVASFSARPPGRQIGDMESIS